MDMKLSLGGLGQCCVSRARYIIIDFICRFARNRLIIAAGGTRLTAMPSAAGSNRRQHRQQQQQQQQLQQQKQSQQRALCGAHTNSCSWGTCGTSYNVKPPSKTRKEAWSFSAHFGPTSSCHLYQYGTMQSERHICGNFPKIQRTTLLYLVSCLDQASRCCMDQKGPWHQDNRSHHHP